MSDYIVHPVRGVEYPQLWPGIHSRLARSLASTMTDLCGCVKETAYSGFGIQTTIQGTEIEVYDPGGYYRPHSPVTIEWSSDSYLIDTFDLRLQGVHAVIGEKIRRIGPSQTRLVFGESSVQVAMPPTDAEVVKGARFFIYPRVWFKLAVAVEKIQS